MMLRRTYQMQKEKPQKLKMEMMEEDPLQVDINLVPDHTVSDVKRMQLQKYKVV
jgi:hypothetical protein